MFSSNLIPSMISSSTAKTINRGACDDSFNAVTRAFHSLPRAKGL